MPLFGKDDEVRIKETLEYIEKKIAPACKTALESKIANRPEASKKISLGFRGLVTNQVETERRKALRSLLLCLHAFGFTAQIAAAKQHYNGKNEAAIKDAVKSFFPDPVGTPAKVVEVARIVKPPLGGLRTGEIYKYRRGAMLANEIAAGGNCYAGAAQWIYLAGFVSLRWLNDHGEMKVGLGVDPAPKAQFTWSGPITDAGGLSAIGSGDLVYFSRQAGTTGTTVHYAIAVDAGKCIGINNPGEVVERWDTAFSPSPALGGAYSEFSTAGYLSTCQKLFRGTGDRGKAAFVRHASPRPQSPY